MKIFNIGCLHFGIKSGSEETIVVSTHGITKKTDKVSKNDLEKAEDVREKYFKETKGRKK